MSRMKFSILFATIYLAIYLTLLYFEFTLAILFLVCSPFVLMYMAYAILKDKHEPKRTFDEYYYMDEDIRA
jgi:multisubunit Na+/H+ antiporter MnhG subunit